MEYWFWRSWPCFLMIEESPPPKKRERNKEKNKGRKNGKKKEKKENGKITDYL